jgi:hypothetical protein
MWVSDIYCDMEWVASRNGALGTPRFKLRGATSMSSGIAIEFHFFGDDECIRHLRVLMDTDDQQAAERCSDRNMQTWVAALESAVMVETGRPFHVAHVPDTQMVITAFGQGDGSSPAATLVFETTPPSVLDYQRVALGFSVWNRDIRYHLFYFRRLIDDSLPIDVRWLNGYRFLEWHFVGDRGKKKLAQAPEWRRFVARFETRLVPYLRPGQTVSGLFEEARAMAAHAGLDDRPEADRQSDPQNAMEKTFRVLEHIVMTVLNEHPARAGHPVRFEPKAQT